MNKKAIKRKSSPSSPAKVLRELRLKKGWSQEELAYVVDMAPANLSNIETGRTRLGEDRAILFAAALGVQPEVLLFPKGYQRKGFASKIRAIKQRVKHL